MEQISIIDRLRNGDTNITKNKIFDFDYLFSILKVDDISEFGIKKREYIDLNLLVINYTNLLNTLYEKDIDSIIAIVTNEKKSFFQKHFYLSKSNYELVWDVNRLSKIVKKKNCIKTILNGEIKSLATTVDVYSLDQKRVKQAINDKNRPIIADMKCTHPSSFILDGNHRIYANAIHNTHHIEVYELGYKDFTKALISDFHRALYYVHHNINFIINYMLGEITEKQLKKLIYPLINTLY